MQTKPIRVVILSVAVMIAGVASVHAQTGTPATGRVVGNAYTTNNSAIVDARVQLRDTVSGQVAATAVTNVSGEFLFDRVPAGSYVIEMVNTSGGVMALGNPFTLAGGETVATFVRIGNTSPVLLAAQPWELALGVSGTWRDGSDGGAPGGGVGVGYRQGRLTPFVELAGTRRDGHNDWRVAGGLRLWVKDWATGGLYAHGGVGALIRNSDAGAAVSAGLGAEWRAGGRVAVRVQGDLTRDNADGATATGTRLSLWAVVR